jgi:hypothetical protein
VTLTVESTEELEVMVELSKKLVLVVLVVESVMLSDVDSEVDVVGGYSVTVNTANSITDVESIVDVTIVGIVVVTVVDTISRLGTDV